MDAPIRLVLFDVNETLSDMSPIRARFEDIGAPGHLAATWFAGVLRDGFALTAAGAYADFRDVADAGLRGLLTGLPGWDGDASRAAGHILDGFADLDVHPDVADGVRALHGAGLRLATLTNGSTAITERLLSRAGLTGCFTALLDVSAPRAWKPAAAAYRYALDTLAADPAETLLVAVHPWDIDGARRAGLQAAWLRRGTAAYPPVLTSPTRTAPDLRELARELVPAAG
ncbi:haloacid dehalogenase type II [Actinomadura sp. 6K520]|uniref:haloacid dehalogenase type II n=1 Tax=Actinomadura sp. 6K520 TaxID=2530364 RepID=UPI001A9F513E|nr:haloacid dehalogenase type II [Actinomadura sp. 6K520]